jgi:hypothetical protein
MHLAHIHAFSHKHAVNGVKKPSIQSPRTSMNVLHSLMDMSFSAMKRGSNFLQMHCKHRDTISSQQRRRQFLQDDAQVALSECCPNVSYTLQCEKVLITWPNACITSVSKRASSICNHTASSLELNFLAGTKTKLANLSRANMTKPNTRNHIHNDLYRRDGSGSSITDSLVPPRILSIFQNLSHL